MALDITAGDAVIYGAYSIGDSEFTFTGFAQEGDVTITPIGDPTEELADGVTVSEQYKNPGLELSGDFVLTSGDETALYIGKLVDITRPGDNEATKWVIQAAPTKYVTETGKIIVSINARHRYSMASAYDDGPIDPDTGSAYAGAYKISGFVNVASTGAALAGVVVSDGTRTGTSDANGAYTIDNVPAGTYTLTPTKANYTFSPSTLTSVAVTTASLIGKNFVATAS